MVEGDHGAVEHAEDEVAQRRVDAAGDLGAGEVAGVGDRFRGRDRVDGLQGLRDRQRQFSHASI
ncbi:hypothetical protein BJF79_46505 [Actinomadura sp. CNU-125]|nr:hypothetical protein BJF79_46505 [Actinomadura sp. CNU-125]